MREALKGCSVSGISRSESPLKRAKRSGNMMMDAYVSIDELNALCTIGNKVRKIIFTDKITKATSE